MSEVFSPLRFEHGALLLLDQTALPGKEIWLRCESVETVAGAIERLAVRGAPAIGVAAAFGLALFQAEGGEGPLAAVERAADRLRRTRPTAVNLHRALDRSLALGRSLGAGAPAEVLREALLRQARELFGFELEACRRMSLSGAELLPPGSRVLTHCNTGALATVGIGTALGVIVEAHRQGRVDHVWVDETRPLGQGLRLTAWELAREGVPHRVVVDGMAGALMRGGEVNAVLVGADRIAANGDTANKIGTYALAVLAQHHGVPFYVVAPTTTVDLSCPSGEAIPIEERSPAEVLCPYGKSLAPSGSSALNWAFDVTPAEKIVAIVTEEGVLRPPFDSSLRRALDSARTPGGSAT